MFVELYEESKYDCRTAKDIVILGGLKGYVR